MQINELTDHLISIKRNGLIIAFDGRCASGKTTVAAALEDAGYAVIHTDDFFLPPNLRSNDRLSTPGGNIHYERLKQQVIIPLIDRSDITYDVFDCSVMNYTHKKFVQKNTPVIIEGAYSLHPLLGKYYDHAYFFDISKKEQLKRLQKRNADKLNDFISKWIPMEEAYFSRFGLPEESHAITVSADIK